jgi:hypothetical protein
VGNRISPLPERARNQTPHGIGQLPEQTLQNRSDIADNKDLASVAILCGHASPGAYSAHT